MSENAIVNSSYHRRWSCPKHGITTQDSGGAFIGHAIDRTPHISVSLPAVTGYGKVRYHCLICYAEWLGANIPRLEEVK